MLAIAFRRETRTSARRTWRRVSLYCFALAVMVVVGLTFRQVAASLQTVMQSQLDDTVSLWLSGIVYTLVLLTSTVILWRLTNWLFFRARVRVRAWRRTADAVRLQRMELMGPAQLAGVLMFVLRVARVFALALLLYIGVPLMLGVFPLTAGFAEPLLDLVLNPLEQVLLAIWNYLPNVLYLAIIYYLARFGLWVAHVFTDAIKRRELVIRGFNEEWADTTYTLVRVLVIFFGIAVSYPYLPGSGSQFFAGLSIFVGALVTLGSTSVVGNLVSGLVLTYSSAFKKGDWVKIGEVVGDVLDKSIFVTRVRTRTNEEIAIPNAFAMSGPIVNYSAAVRRGTLVLTVSVGLGYDLDWRRVHELMKRAATETDRILAAPEPFVLQKALGNFAVEYELNACTSDARRMAQTMSALRQKILDVFDIEGVEILTPAVASLRDGSDGDGSRARS